MKKPLQYWGIFISLLFLFNNLPAHSITGGEKGKKSLTMHIDSMLNSVKPEKSFIHHDEVLFSDSLVYPFEVYRLRIEVLGRTTLIPLQYNEYVQKYINAYTLPNRDKLNRIAGLSEYYFPLFEEYLAKYNLPLELKYLASVESALDPNAVSPSGAVGLWQFIKPTADLFDLQVSSYVDERRDPYRSTDAACRYLEYLYRTFGDWLLVLAAYNGGPGMVKKAIIRGGSNDYWQIRQYMTEQMQNYVPAFIAMCYLMNFSREHQIIPLKSDFDFFDVDTIHVFGPLNLVNLANEMQFPAENILLLNPTYYRNFIPSDGKEYALVLPHEYISKYLEIVSDSLSQSTKNLRNTMVVTSGTSSTQVPVQHVVKKGESLHRIAITYGCTVDEILKWNKLPDNHQLLAGETLTIILKK